MSTKYILLIMSLFLYEKGHDQFLRLHVETKQSKKQIEWYSFNDLDSLIKNEPLENSKNIVIYFHTTWCVYCRKMEQSVFNDPEIIRISNKFHFIKFDAESNENIEFEGITYAKEEKAKFHYIAQLLANRDGEMVFPTILILNSEFKLLSKSHQYLSRKQLKALLTTNKN